MVVTVLPETIRLLPAQVQGQRGLAFFNMGTQSMFLQSEAACLMQGVDAKALFLRIVCKQP
jgi:hypothetical protein